ncbi:hypothetical protein K0M31_004561 [Melipona bicolor]|uniref:RNMT-activating mini protein n=1 Tax=Melipona bicolor TaxID=60889 RepID=A0AA40FXH8_9HYME|nr:hypothetical protein K0M31_004561 [Melipona bicolor]
MEEKNLTDEQKKFLEECENEFKDRYTEKEAEFMKIKNMELNRPPIIDPWYSKNGRYNNDRRRHFNKYSHHRHRPYP